MFKKNKESKLTSDYAIGNKRNLEREDNMN